MPYHVLKGFMVASPIVANKFLHIRDGISDDVNITMVHVRVPCMCMGSKERWSVVSPQGNPMGHQGVLTRESSFFIPA